MVWLRSRLVLFKNLDESLGIDAETSERHKLRKPVGQEEFQNPPYEHHDKYVEGHATENLALRVELSRHRIPELHQLVHGSHSHPHRCQHHE